MFPSVGLKKLFTPLKTLSCSFFFFSLSLFGGGYYFACVSVTKKKRKTDISRHRHRRSSLQLCFRICRSIDQMTVFTLVQYKRGRTSDRQTDSVKSKREIVDKYTHFLYLLSDFTGGRASTASSSCVQQKRKKLYI